MDVLDMMKLANAVDDTLYHRARQAGYSRQELSDTEYLTLAFTEMLNTVRNIGHGGRAQDERRMRAIERRAEFSRMYARSKVANDSLKRIADAASAYKPRAIRVECENMLGIRILDGAQS